VTAWLESRFLLTRIRLESRWEKALQPWILVKWFKFFRFKLDSSHVFHRMARLTINDSKLESESFLQNSWWINPVHLHTKKQAFFTSVMIKIGGNFLFCLFSRAMLHFKDQISSTCIEEDLRPCFHWGVGRAQYIDTLSWFNGVFAYRDHGSGSILWPWVFSRYQQGCSDVGTRSQTFLH